MHVNVSMLRGALGQLEAAGQLTGAAAYLHELAPVLEVDKWGEPLPLSPSDQNALDRVFAVLSEPYARGKALLTSGLLAPDEVDALIDVYPDIWQRLCKEAADDMARTPPPYVGWAEDTLSVLFKMPPERVFAEGPPPAPMPKTESLEAKVGTTATPADRRETAVREGA
jgi:hypothetical protein